MKRIVNSVMLRLILIAVVFFVLVVHPNLRISSALAGSSLPAPAPSLKTESQIRSEASRYEAAIREIARISQLQPGTPDGSKAAQAILDKQAPNLRLYRSKLIAFGLNDSTFAAAIKARAGDQKSAEQFAGELGKDHSAILKVNGAQSVLNNILSSSNTDIALLRRIAEQLNLAAADIRTKARGHHAFAEHSTVRRINGEPANPMVPADKLSPEDATLLVVAASVVLCPPLALLFFNVAATALLPLAYVTAILSPLLLLPGNAEKVEECMNKARANCDHCKNDASKLFFPLNIAAADACDAELLFEETVCMATLGAI